MSLKTVLGSALFSSLQNSSNRDIPQPTYAHKSRLLSAFYPIFLSLFGASKSPKLQERSFFSRALKSLFLLSAKSSQDRPNRVFLLFPCSTKVCCKLGEKKRRTLAIPFLLFFFHSRGKARCSARVRSLLPFPYSIPYLEGRSFKSDARSRGDHTRIIPPVLSHFHPEGRARKKAWHAKIRNPQVRRRSASSFLRGRRLLT